MDKTNEDISLDATVSLREITAETVGPVCRLSATLTPPKSNFVALNAYSIAQAHFDDNAWFRAVYADETSVGFVMSDQPEVPRHFLWRFMIAQE